MSDNNRTATVFVQPHSPDYYNNRPVATTVTIRPQQQQDYNNSPNNGQPGDAGASSAIYVQLNLPYFASIPGLLMLLEVLFGIICMACASPAFVPGSSWFLFVVVISFIFTLVWFFFHLLSLRTVVHFKQPVPWLTLETWYTIGVAVFYFTAFVVQLAVWSSVLPTGSAFYRGSNIAAGCFGLFNTIVYGLAGYLLYKKLKEDPMVTVVN